MSPKLAMNGLVAVRICATSVAEVVVEVLLWPVGLALEFHTCPASSTQALPCCWTINPVTGGGGSPALSGGLGEGAALCPLVSVTSACESTDVRFPAWRTAT